MFKKLLFSKSRCIPVCGLVVLGILAVFSLIRAAGVSAPDDFAYVREVRAIDTQKFGIARPVGLAFSPKANALLLIEGQKAEETPLSRSGIVMISILPGSKASARLAVDISDPLNVTFSPRAGGLFMLDAATHSLLQIGANPKGQLNLAGKAITRDDVGRFAILDPQGITSDPENGDLYVLDSNGPHILRLSPGPGQDFGRATVEWIPASALASAGAGMPGRIAFNPENRHLYLFNPVDQKLFELTRTGAVASVRDLSPFHLDGPQAMVFAPSGDQTDEASIMSLYLADSGRDAVSGQTRGRVVELSLTAPVLSDSFVAVDPVPGTLANTIDTAAWIPPSPDPSGIGYNPATGTYWVSDSEVEGTTVWADVNMFEMTPDGLLQSTYNTIPNSYEPTGIGWNSTTDHAFISDDDMAGIFEVDPGPDLIFGTGDEVWSFVDATTYGAGDPEGVAFDSENGVLFIVDGVNAEVYIVTAGPNGYFDGGPPGDDVVTSFDTSGFDLPNTDGIAYNQDSKTIYLAGPSRKNIIETTLDGTVVRIIDVHADGVIAASGLSYGPASAGPDQRSIYLTDRAHDLGEDPLENDGKIFEYSVTWPMITSFDPPSGPVGTEVTLTGLGFTGATEVAFGGEIAIFTVDSDTTITATVPAGAMTGSISVTTPGGASASLGDFTVIPTPVVISFDPTSGPVGIEVTITGTDFTGATEVAFNGLSADFTLDSDTTITATVPEGATTGPISVTTPGGTAVSSSDFTVTPSPTVALIKPNIIQVGVKVDVVVRGSYFMPGAILSFENGRGTVPKVLKSIIWTPQKYFARILVPEDGLKSDWDVVVTNTDGGRGVLPAGLHVKRWLP